MDYVKICINCMHEKQDASGVCPVCGFDPSDYCYPSYALPPFTILNGRYLLGIVLGSGGFGITYIAYDLVLKCTRSLKEFFMSGAMYRDTEKSLKVSVIIDNPAQKQVYQSTYDKFIQEARILARMEQLPGIVSAYDVFNENGTSYIVMEYLEGITLKQHVAERGGGIPYQEFLEKIHPVISSLEKLHDSKIYHRDISPDNIMVRADGSYCLFDFGSAKVSDTAGVILQSETTVKKSGYTPVEQHYSGGKLGPWTDEYALCATIYYCICGKTPPDSVSRIAGNDTLEPPRNFIPKLPVRTENAILKGLSPRKEDRYPDLNVLERALYSEAEGKSSLGKGSVKKILIPVIILVAAATALFCLRYKNLKNSGSGEKTPEKMGVTNVPKLAGQPDETETPKAAMSLTPEATAESTTNGRAIRPAMRVCTKNTMRVIKEYQKDHHMSPTEGITNELVEP